MMKNNLFLQIKIRMITTIYIVFVLSGVLGSVLCNVLFGVLLGYCSTPDSTPKRGPIYIAFFGFTTLSATHKKEGLLNYKKKNMSRWIGFYLPFLPGLSAHKGRKCSNEICQNRAVYEYLYRSRIVQVQ